MKISAKGRYALRLMADLALQDPSEYIALKDVSARQEISVKYLEQIVGALSRAGFVRSVRGPQGGYRLARNPEEYTVGEILQVTEGSLAPVACLEDEPNRCSRYAVCSTVHFWEGFYEQTKNYVNSITLQELAQGSAERNAARKGNEKS